ncbi:hypothetical protein KQL69_004362 [Escherichia coli]|nr:hypothetical protein [Escherichia coli]EHP9630651.1 hypothetical protein [Escherichia coli]EHP9640738.1 hypothetical protein [Escherichia coli]EHP9646066.1 hypothetical protein [Escherichia coli]EHP9661173.1 hypothetical protein [Escherichia coli]
MKYSVIAVIILFLLSSKSYAEEVSIDSGDPCTVFMCMAGKVYGENSSECKGPTKKFFNIIKKKKGRIRWSKTFDARKAFLMNCPRADPAHVSKIMSKFGRKLF